jgi:type III pantothenate kinase
MTALVMDIGNSRVKWALADGNRLRLPSEAIGHEDIERLFAAWQALPAAPGQVRLVSVIDRPLVSEIEDWVAQHWGINIQRVRTPAEGGGIRIAYPEPGQLGTDRWLAMVAAREKSLLPACIIDCGSAITLDMVDEAGLHRGGMILPGVAAQQAGLSQIAPALPQANPNQPAPLLACNTAHAVAAGLLQGTAAAIEGLHARFAAETGLDLPMLLTGGDAAHIEPYLQRQATVLPDLVLAGLASLD